MGSHRHHHEPAVDTHTFLQESLELVVAIELRSAPLVLAGVVREDGIRVQAVEEVLDGVGVSIDDLGRLDERADLRRVSAAVRAPCGSLALRKGRCGRMEVHSQFSTRWRWTKSGRQFTAARDLGARAGHGTQIQICAMRAAGSLLAWLQQVVYGYSETAVRKQVEVREQGITGWDRKTCDKQWKSFGIFPENVGSQQQLIVLLIAALWRQRVLVDLHLDRG